MGHAIITDIADGWAATYPAAAAKGTSCGACQAIDGGTRIGYENYPMEVYLPFALAEPIPGPGSGLRNILSLWGPGLLPAAPLLNTSINLDIKWWDGRERFFITSDVRHSFVRPLGGPAIGGLDPPLDESRFNVVNFTCGLSGGGGGTDSTPAVGQAENDGFPRAGASSTNCGAPLPNPPADASHPSDNQENTPEINGPGHSIQSSTPVSWWRFRMRRDGLVPITLRTFIDNVVNPTINLDHSGRGLVGVVLTSTIGGTSGIGVGDATRLWHKAPCELAQSGLTWGPIHASVMDHGQPGLSSSTSATGIFNTLSFIQQGEICDGQDYDGS
jgi:hypothetical protein